MSELNLELERLGIISRDRLETYYPRVRDRDDVSVLLDPLTEVIVLSRCDHVSENYYAERKETKRYSVHEAEVVTPRLEDNIRRGDDFGSYIKGKRWLDFGCGLGGMLDELAADAEWAGGLEPNKARAVIVKAKGHQVISSLEELDDASIDIVTMFHVLEHLTDPVGVLKALRRVLRPGGGLIIEVPHARDALFTLYDCEEFKKFTFWSEHLVLHTRHSLQLLLKAAGYPEHHITSYQRYPLANHLYWLSRGKPGGHGKWSFFCSKEMERAYSECMAQIDQADTLIGIVKI